MIKTFIALPDQKIRISSQEVKSFDNSLVKLITDLVDTASAQTNPIALGLAAPQIGVFKHVFVAKIRNKFKPFVNPKIIKSYKNRANLMEGCFSVGGIYGGVTRPAEVDIEAFDAYGKKFVKHLKGLEAKIFQHELDHLTGVLFIDYVKKQNGKLFKVKTNKKKKEELIELPLADWDDKTFEVLK
ncbi:MAG: peptide deformylase [Candidatus Curtissbacteria bacterium]|nr:peptide deformylase [Candidatus Curtissbacteria bacterium]